MEAPSQQQHFTSFFPDGLSPQLQTTNAPDTGGGAHPQQNMVYPTHSVGPSSAAVTSAPAERRKRGRPRKYGTPEQALAARKNSSNNVNNKDKNGTRGGGEASPFSSSSSSSKNVKSHHHSLALGGVGQGFTSHVINVTPGEDVGQKLMLFMQQSKREMCILSASGTISNASLRQPLTSGGIITYEGRFDILSLSGSYVRTDVGGKSGGLSICLSSSDGQFVGGRIGGPLRAAGPVQVIVGTFLLDHKKDAVAGVKVDMSDGKLPSPVGGSAASSIGFRSPIDSSGRNATIQANIEHQNVGGNPFLIQHTSMLMPPARPTDWRGGPDARTIGTYDFSGTAGHGAHQSPENGDYV